MWEEETDSDTDGRVRRRGGRHEGVEGGGRQRGRPILCRVPLLLLSATKDHQGRLAHASHTLMVTTPDTPRDLQAETNIYSLFTTPDTPRDLKAETNIYSLFTTPDTPRDLKAETNIYNLFYSGQVLMSKAESEAGVYAQICKHGV